MKKSIVFWCTIMLVACSVIIAHASEKQMVFGAGPSTKLVQLFFSEFEKMPACEGYSFEVPPKSVKHAGGIKSCEKYIFGRTGRPLNAKEKNMNKEEIFLGQVPVAIAVGSAVNIDSLDMDQLANIITGKYTNWKQVGGPDAAIVNVGRESKEALYSILKARYPFFNKSKFTKIFKKDHEVVAFISNPHGKYAISFGAEPNFRDVDGLKIVKVTGFSAGQALGLVYDKQNENNSLVGSVKKFAKSEEWAQIAVANGYIEIRN